MILMIEPHPDDLALSTDEYIKECMKTDPDVLWVSVTNPRDFISYPKSLGITRIKTLALPDDGREPYAKLTPKETSREDYWTYAPQKFLSLENYQIWTTRLKDLLYRVVHNSEISKVLCPLGIKHVHHILTRCCIDTMFSPDKIDYYRDQPYGYYVCGTAAVNRCGKKVVWEAQRTDTTLKDMKIHYPSEWYFYARSNNIHPIQIWR